MLGLLMVAFLEDSRMRVQLSENAQELLGKSEFIIITERVDDVVLLIGQMMKMGLVEALDKHIPRHWNQRGLSWGWTAVVVSVHPERGRPSQGDDGIVCAGHERDAQANDGARY